MRAFLLIFLSAIIFSTSICMAGDSKASKDGVKSKYLLSFNTKSEDETFYYISFKLNKTDKSAPEVEDLTFSLLKNKVKVLDPSSLLPSSIYGKRQAPSIQWFMSKEQSEKMSKKGKTPSKGIVLKIRKTLFRIDSKDYSVEIQDETDNKIISYAVKFN